MPQPPPSLLDERKRPTKLRRVERIEFFHSIVQSTPTMRSVQSSPQRLPGPAAQATGIEQSRLLKNGAPAQAFTREERARGGHARAEKIRKRKELREQFDIAGLEDFAAAEPELLDQALTSRIARHAARSVAPGEQQ